MSEAAGFLKSDRSTFVRPVDLARYFVEYVPLEQRATEEENRIAVRQKLRREIHHHAALAHAPERHRHAADRSFRAGLANRRGSAFPALKDSFAPWTRGRIGFAGEIVFPPRIGMYGFRAIADVDEELLLIPTDANDDRGIRLFVAGVDEPHTYGLIDRFRSRPTAAQVRATEIADQLSKLVEKGRLNEAAAPELAEELIACVLKTHRFFEVFIDPKTKRVRFPVDPVDVMTALKREFLNRHFRDEAVQAKRERGEIKEEWRGSIVSYSANLSLGRGN